MTTKHSPPTISDIFAERYNFDWVSDPDHAIRLYHGLQLMRNVVRIPWPDAIVVNWATRDAPFHGCLTHTTPPEILIDPKPLLRPIPTNHSLILDVLLGTVLHEGSHAAFTPVTWMSEAERLLAEHQRTTGYRLPPAMMDALQNWAEDVYVEDQLVQRFPGFLGYFRNAWGFFLPPTTCRRRLRTVQRLLRHLPTTSDKRANSDHLVAAIVNLIVVAVQHPEDFADPIRAVVPEVAEAAQEIRQAQGETDVARRLGHAIASGDRIFRYLVSLLNPRLDLSTPQAEPAHVSDDPLRAARAELVRILAGRLGQQPIGRAASAPTPHGPRSDRSPETSGVAQVAQRIDELVKERKPVLRDRGDPRGKQVAKRTIPRHLQQALELLEEGHAVFLPATQITASPLAGPFTIRVIDSHPTTLPAPPYDLDMIAPRLFAEYRLLAEDVRWRLRFRDAPIESIEYGQRQGDLDDYRLVDLVMGSPDVFYRREQTPGRKVALTVLVDESGSMSQANHWKLAAAASICLEYAVRSLAGVRLRVFGFTGDVIKHETLVYRHYDSAVSRLRRPWALGYSYPKAYTPTGLALAAVRQELRQGRHSAESRQALLLISDGQPQAVGYAPIQGAEHVAAEVRRLGDEGIAFAALQIGLTVGEDELTRMYGQRWRRVIRSEEIPSSIVSLALTYLDPSRV